MSTWKSIGSLPRDFGSVESLPAGAAGVAKPFTNNLLQANQTGPP